MKEDAFLISEKRPIVEETYFQVIYDAVHRPPTHKSVSLVSTLI